MSSDCENKGQEKVSFTSKVEQLLKGCKWSILNSNGKGQLLQICILTNLLSSLNQNTHHNCCGVYILVNEVLDDCVKI